MATKNEAHDMVIESLTQGLLQLMTQKPLAQINVSELCDRAGVSRVSFYRNFKSMQDILIQDLTACTDEWYQTFSQKPDEEFLSCFCVELLEQYRRHADLIRLLYNNDAAHLLKEHIFACCKLDEFTAPEEAYPRAVLAGAVYGLVDEWIHLGMGQLPEHFSLRRIVSAVSYQREEPKK